MVFALRGSLRRDFAHLAGTAWEYYMCSPRAVSYDLIRAVCVALRARARHWVRMDYFCLLTLRLECIAAWISVARLIATRFRAYSQGPHVSICSLRSVRNDLI